VAEVNRVLLIIQHHPSLYLSLTGRPSYFKLFCQLQEQALPSCRSADYKPSAEMRSNPKCYGVWKLMAGHVI